MGWHIHSDRTQREWRRTDVISFYTKKVYIFTIFSNKSHEFRFGSNTIIIIVGDEQDIVLACDCTVEL